MKKTLALILALLMLAPTVLASCAESEQNTEETQGTLQPGAESTTETEAESENPYYDGYEDPFADVNFDGATFTVHNSTNAATATMPSSAYLIAGPEEYTGDLASDAAYDRNLSVADMLGVNLVFESFDFVYGDVAANIRTLVQSGDTTYDLIVNDIYGLAPTVNEGLFRDANDGANFNFSNPWWYNDFMSDIAIRSDVYFMLAGDFFIDMLRTAHCLIMNKDIYRDSQLGTSGDPEEVYQMVINKEWTLDRYRSLLESTYYDKNGNGLADKGDQFGYLCENSWGSILPFIVSGDPGFIERDEEGYPILTVNSDRAVTVYEKINAAFNNDANYVGKLDESSALSTFLDGGSLFIGYLRLGTLENASIRESDIDLAVLPYPMTDELQNDYVTSAHDTSELGFIPSTVDDERLDFVSTVIEVLCRETYSQILPTYYESSLKIKYTRDNSSAQMIDIIHDHFDNGFALAYSNGIGGVMLKSTFGDAIEQNTDTFASRMKSQSKVANKLLSKIANDCRDMLASKGK